MQRLYDDREIFNLLEKIRTKLSEIDDLTEDIHAELDKIEEFLHERNFEKEEVG